MAQTTVVIANMALGLLGSSRIENIDDPDDKLAADCRFWLEQSIREIGFEHWNDLRDLADLPQDETAPEFGFFFRYKVPTDCLMVLKVNGDRNAANTGSASGSFTVDDVSRRQPYWRRFGRFIHTDDEVCKIEYVKFFDTTSEMGGAFNAALACLMASYLAPTIRNDGGKRGDELRFRYDRILLPRARMRSANEKNRPPADVTDQSRYIGFRRFGTAPTGRLRR